MNVEHRKEYFKCDICGDVIGSPSREFSVLIHKSGESEVRAHIGFSYIGSPQFGYHGCDVCSECIATTVLSKAYGQRLIREIEQ